MTWFSKGLTMWRIGEGFHLVQITSCPRGGFPESGVLGRW